MKISDMAFPIPADMKRYPSPGMLQDIVIEISQEEVSGDPGSIEEGFRAVCRRYPEHIALADEKDTMTFSELDRYAAAIAGFILEKELPPESPVGVMCSRSWLFVASFLGILRSNAVYVPLDPLLPLKRREIILNDCNAKLLITDSQYAGDAGRLEYACPGLTWILCPDVENFEDAIEKPGELMSIELWNHVTSEVADGSWKSLFDDQPLAVSVLTELAANLYEKTKSRLGPKSRVLDIGSGAGKVARTLIAHCQHYTSVDLSRQELGRVEKLALEFKHPGVDTHQMEALDINLLSLKDYDLVVLNSVIENFPGYNYLRRVLDRAIEILRDGGILFVGSVWDMEKKSLFIEDLKKNGEITGNFSGMVRLEQGDELFVPKSFFMDWASTCSKAVEVNFSSPGIDSRELCDYRFDVIIRKNIETKKDPQERPITRYGSSALSVPAPHEEKETDFPPLSPASAVYMIYTSGTTGKPKGVVIEQEGLLNLFNGLNRLVYGQPGDDNDEKLQLALLASFSFDASMQQIIAALLGGHSLHIVPDTVKTDPRALYQFLKTRKIDLCDGTPSLFSLLTDFCLDEKLVCPVGTFIIGGEVLRSDLLVKYFSIEGHKACRIFNAYGPTECSVDATIYEFNRSNHNAYVIPPIGYALPNTEITVRGKKHEILPEGMPGELWIRGKGVARGYFGDDALTDSRFVMSGGERWYRTGDIGRYIKDHLFFFNGRDDHQVKVGGFRVEIGEIETILNACPLVDRAVVTADDFSGNGVKTLACFFVPAGQLDLSRIREYLRGHLPAYAIPSYYVDMRYLPLTASGKIDYYSLPSPVKTMDSLSTQKIRPMSGPIEEKIAGLWEGLLGRKIESAESDFFELGGHSILGVRLISLIEKNFGKRLSLSHLFKATTIAAQAKLIENSSGDQCEYTPLIPFSTEGTAPPIFLFHPVGGHALSYRPLANILADRFPVYGVEAPGIHTDSPWLLSVEEMADMYLAHIIKEFPGRPVIFAGWSFGGLVAYEAVRKFELQGGEVKGLILLDTVADNRMAREMVQKDEAAMLTTLFSETLPVTEINLREKTGDERLNYLIDLGVENGVLPAGFGLKKMRRLIQIYHGNALASARYSPVKRKGKALLIRPSEISASAMNMPDDPTQGWGSLLEGGVVLKWMKGNHESMMMEHSAKELADFIYRYLDQTGLDDCIGENNES